MGMYSALMQEIGKGLEEIKKEDRQVVEITRTVKVLTAPFRLSEEEKRRVLLPENGARRRSDTYIQIQHFRILQDHQVTTDFQ